MSTLTFTIEEVTLPERVDAADAADFVAGLEVGNAVESIGFGTPDITFEPDEALPHWHDPQEPTRLLVAKVDGRVVAEAEYTTQVGESADTGWLAVRVLPEFRGHGIGTGLAEAIERLPREDGKAKAVVYTALQDLPGPRIPSPTGFGSIPAEHPDVRFLLSRGYQFEQVERLSRLPLPVADLDARMDAAATASGPDYVVHLWEGDTPERWYEDMALLFTRMSTDAPSAGLEEPEDVWDAQRIIDTDVISARSPRVRYVAAAEHLPTGRLVAFTTLSVPPQRHRAVAQWGTLVLREHRGHRLGMLLKVANLRHLQALAPGHPSVTTFNAEENRYMLDVNEALGFVPIGMESAWRKDLT